MNHLKSFWRSTAVTLATTVAVLVALILLTPRLSFLEMKALDLLLRATCSGRPPAAVRVVDVGSDASRYASLHAPGDDPPNGCAVPRRALALATDRLSRWGAKAIILDLVFERSCKFEDATVAKAFARAGNVIGCTTTATRPGAVAVIPPVSPLAEAVWGLGTPVVEAPNGTIRGVPLTVQAENSETPYLAVSLMGLLRFKGLKPRDVKPGLGSTLQVGPTAVPVARNEQLCLLPMAPLEPGADKSAGDSGGLVVVSGSVTPAARALPPSVMLIRWVGPPGTIPTQPLWELLALSDAEGRGAYQGKAVVIGRSASLDPGVVDYDAHLTTMGPMNGIEIQANALQTLLSGNFVQPLAPGTMLAVLAALALIASLVARTLRGWRATAAIFLLLVAVALLAVELLAHRGVWLYLLLATTGVLLSWGLTEASESRKVSRLLTRFVPAFLTRAETHGGQIRSLDATLLYSDIRGFTTTAEQLSSADMLGMLNVFHSAIEESITRHGGSIVKVPGDAVLAAFWRDHKRANHATSALRAAREMLANLPALARAWEAAGVTLEIGIGLNSGPVAMGLSGKHHLEPTVIGDAVNVSARLEGLTKEVGCPLVLSEETYQLLQDESGAVYLAEFTVKGRQAPVKCYGIAGTDGLPERWVRPS